MRLSLLAALICICCSIHGQNLQLINSGEVINQAGVAYDSGDYASAIKALQTIHEADTNYVYMLSELADAYQANKEYDKALQVVELGLKQPSVYRISFLRTQAISYEKKGEIDKSVSLLRSAIAEYPTSPTLWFSLGVNYFNSKAYDKAIDCFFKVLSINPFHGASHLNLGRLAILQGRKVHGMFSLGIYLGVNTNDNSSLVLLDNFLDNEVTDESTITPVGINAAEKLDRIIKARIAMEKDFKSKIPVTAAVVKQFELLFDQISSLPTNPEDKWMTFYLPSYRAIKESQLVEPFIYHMLTSSTIEAAKKWRSKNEDELNKFYRTVNVELSNHRKLQTVEAYGFTKPTPAWYSGNNVLEAIGIRSGEVRQGRFVYLHSNQNKMAEGTYDQSGKKIGIWKYYHEDGVLKSEENFDTGKATVFFKDKKRKEEFALKDDKIEGEVILYYECGAVKEKLGYKNGEREGKGESYYISGKIKNKYTHQNDLLQGEYVSFYENGAIESKRNYEKGYFNGPYHEYHANGKPLSEGEYANGESVGTWTFYHDTGKISRTGSYSPKGNPINEWKYFDEKGLLLESRKFNTDGERHGENAFYDDGKIHYSFTYKNGLMTKCVYFDKTGKVTASFGANNGDFAVKHFYNTGQLSSEGSYKKGRPDGVWKYYDRYGNRTAECEYKEGLTTGVYKTFYSTGEKKLVCNYVDDELDGYFIEYYRNGNIKQEGWYQQGLRQQRWISYHTNGRIETEYFFLNDKRVGTGIAFGVDEKKTSTFYYANDKITDIKLFGPDGKERGVRSDKETGFSTISYYPNKKIRLKYEVECGLFGGEFLSQNPEGKTFIRYTHANGERNGAYEYNNADGTKDVGGSYKDGLHSGLWKSYFENGKLYFEGHYSKGQQDSVWRFYFPNGNLSSTSMFENGSRQGITQYYTPDGVLILEKLFKDDDMIAYRSVESGKTNEWVPFTGNAKIQVKNSSGAIVYEQELKNGERHGQYKLCFSNGNVHEVYQYKNGERSGEYSIYFSNGKVAERGAYQNDERDGVIQYFNENGTLQKTETYRLGAQHGKAVTYSAGKPLKEINFWNGYIE